MNVEKVWVVMVIAFAVSIGGYAASQVLFASTIREHAENDARAYGVRMHPTWPRVVVDCQGVDSDGDGYVRCTVGDGVATTEAVECRTSVVIDYQRGCVPMRMAPREGSR